jgi:hypothetical protein
VQRQGEDKAPALRDAGVDVSIMGEGCHSIQEQNANNFLVTETQIGCCPGVVPPTPAFPVVVRYESRSGVVITAMATTKGPKSGDLI